MVVGPHHFVCFMVSVPSQVPHASIDNPRIYAKDRIYYMVFWLFRGYMQNNQSHVMFRGQWRGDHLSYSFVIGGYGP